MSYLNSFSKCWGTLLKLSSMKQASGLLPQKQQARNKWPDYRMKKDARKRNTVKEHGADRLRVLAVKRNSILPVEIREIAGEEINQISRYANHLMTQPRCQLTSRPRGNLIRWRLSRLVFRHLADYNKLSGVQRALW